MNVMVKSNIECIWRLLHDAWPKRLAILETFLWTVVAITSKIAQISLVKTTVEVAFNQGSMIDVLKPFFLLAACIIITVSSEVTHQWKMTVIIQRLTLDMQGRVHRKLHRMSDAFLDKESPGELAFRTLQDTAASQQAVGIVLGTVVTQIITVATLGSYLFYLKWQMAVVTLSGYAIMVPLVRYGTRPLKTMARELQEMRASIQQRFLNLLSGRDIFRCFDLSGQQIESLPKTNDRFHIRAKQYLAYRGLINSVSQVMIVLFAMAVVLYIGWLVRQDSMSPGTTAAATAVLFSLYPPITRLAHAGTALRESLVSAQRAFEILNAPDFWQEKAGGIVPASRIESVTFDQVYYKAVERDFTLRGLSFSLRAGEIALLVGPTGCGKTTLVRLLIMSLAADSGAIMFNSFQSNRVFHGWLWSNLAYIPQRCPAVGMTIRDELDLGGQSLNERKLEEAAQNVELDVWIRQLPKGWETRIGPDGVTLSGGQRQRLALARVFLTSRSLYVLDEPTSQLDQEIEKRIINSLCQYIRRQNAIGFIVSHRPAFVEKVDRLFIIRNGTLTEVPGKKANIVALEQEKSWTNRFDFDPEIQG